MKARKGQPGRRTGKRTPKPEKTRVRPRRAATRAAWPSGWFTCVVLVLLFTVAAILHVRAKMAVVQLGYKLSEASREHKRLLAAQRKLQVEVATLRSPRRLRSLAEGTLGLAEPAPSQILRTVKPQKRKLAMGDR